MIYPKLLYANECIHWFAFIACGANSNGWICTSPSLLLFHVTHKTTSTIHTKLKWWPCIYTCNKISDRSVSVNVILLRALSLCSSFFTEIPILVDDIEIDMCVCVCDGNKVINYTGGEESHRMEMSNESMACNCMYYIYLSFAHAYRMFQCHLRVSHCHPIPFLLHRDNLMCVCVSHSRSCFLLVDWLVKLRGWLIAEVQIFNDVDLSIRFIRLFAFSWVRHFSVWQTDNGPLISHPLYRSSHFHSSFSTSSCDSTKKSRSARAFFPLHRW